MNADLGGPRVALAALAILAGVACTPAPETVDPAAGFPVLSGPYLGQELPGRQPELFAPGIISTGLADLNSVFSPDGKEFYYAVDIGLDLFDAQSRPENGSTDIYWMDAGSVDELRAEQ